MRPAPAAAAKAQGRPAQAAARRPPPHGAPDSHLIECLAIAGPLALRPAACARPPGSPRSALSPTRGRAGSIARRRSMSMPISAHSNGAVAAARFAACPERAFALRRGPRACPPGCALRRSKRRVQPGPGAFRPQRSGSALYSDAQKARRSALAPPRAVKRIRFELTALSPCARPRTCTAAPSARWSLSRGRSTRGSLPCAARWSGSRALRASTCSRSRTRTWSR